MAVVILAVIGTLVVVFRLTPSEPVYQGRKLTEYFAAFAHDGAQMHNEPPFDLVGVFSDVSDRRRQAWEAVPKFGTNALPMLIDWLRAEDTGLDRWMIRLQRKQSLIKFTRLTAGEKRIAALTALNCLGRKAEPALPRIIPLLSDPRYAREAAYAVTFIRPTDQENILALTNALNRLDEWAQREVMAALGSFGIEAAPALPAIAARLASTNLLVRASAGVAITRIDSGDYVLPPIIESLEKIAAIQKNNPPVGVAAVMVGIPVDVLKMNLWTLGEFGVKAKSASPMISNFVNDPDPRIRDSARSALKKIAVESEHSRGPTQ